MFRINYLSDKLNLRKQIAIMSRHWFRQFASRFRFPENYTTIDIETSGVSPEHNLICSIGHSVVRNRVLVSCAEAYLNWTIEPCVNQEELLEDLKHVNDAFVARGSTFHHNYRKLQTNGEPPRQVLQRYLDMFEAMERRQEVLVAHNGWKFDIEFFRAAFINWLGVGWEFVPELVYDTGVIEKASQLPDSYDPLPFDGESMQDFALRIGSIRAKGIYWALDKHCEKEYELSKRAGGNKADCHSAAYDSLLVHYLLETHRELAANY